MSVDNAYAVELKGLTFRRGARTIFDKVDIACRACRHCRVRTMKAGRDGRTVARR